MGTLLSPMHKMLPKHSMS